MFFIKNESKDPYYNLAFEEYVFKNCHLGDTILLLWQNCPSVIIGRYQNTIEEINSGFIEERGINVVRRITGGGAVYHDLGNLNYSFIIPDTKGGIDFKTFTKPLIMALEELGIKVEQTGRNDITIDGGKFSGNAQYYHKECLLHHGTILFDANLDDVQAALKVKPGKIQSKSIKSVRSRVTNLKPHFKGDITVDEFKQLLLQFFITDQGASEWQLAEGQKAEIEALASEKYRSWEWTYGQSPKADVVKSAFFRCGYVEFHFNVDQGIIQKANLIGDFFSSREIDGLLESFGGVKYDRKELAKALGDVDLRAYLGDITVQEIVDVIC